MPNKMWAEVDLLLYGKSLIKSGQKSGVILHPDFHPPHYYRANT